MTAPRTDDALAETIGALVRSRPRLSDADAQAFARALSVPCVWCGSAAGELCARSDGGPLVKLLAHNRRLADSGATLGATDERFREAGAKTCRDADPAQGCPRCHPPRSRTADEWPHVPPPSTPAADDQGWRR